MDLAAIQETKELQILDLGFKQYAECWKLQKQLQQQRIQNTIPDTLILCEHEAVVTCGRSYKAEQLILSPQQLQAENINYFETERGGSVTYHGPGQLVCYPIIDLKMHKRDVGWYMRTLEQVLINTLSSFGIEAVRNPGLTGVWVQQSGGDVAKIAAIGVRLSRWCSMHGFALNVLNQLEGFKSIVPCGIENITITCLESELVRINYNDNNMLEGLMARVKNCILDDFLKVFNYSA